MRPHLALHMKVWWWEASWLCWRSSMAMNLGTPLPSARCCGSHHCFSSTLWWPALGSLGVTFQDPCLSPVEAELQISSVVFP